MRRRHRVQPVFFCLQVADVVLGIGESSFVGNAASAGLGVARVGAQPICGSDGRLTEEELERVRGGMEAAVKVASQVPEHVEL